MEAINELGLATFVMAAMTSLYALLRLAMRSSSAPALLQHDATAYVSAIMMTLGFAGAMYLFGSALVPFMSPYIAIVLAIAAQGALVAGAMQIARPRDADAAELAPTQAAA